MELVNKWVPPGGHTQKDFSSGRWRIKWLFGNVSRRFATYGVHVSPIACLVIAWESASAWTGLRCDIPGIIFGNVAIVVFPDHGASGLQPRPKQTGAEELSVPKLSLALSHQCPAGRGRGKGCKKSRGKGRKRLVAEELPGAPAADLTTSPPASIAIAPSEPSRNNGSWSRNFIIELQCGVI